MPKRLTQEEFINLAQAAHGNVYDYSLVKYVNFRTPVIVVCRTCGPFSVRPHLHTSNKTTCPTCSLKSITGSLEAFVEQCNLKFDCSNLDFSETVYTGCKHPVTIRCTKHGTFTKKRAYSMLSSKGCPVCAKQENGQYKWGCINQNSQLPMTVYIVHFRCILTGQYFYKIGITKRTTNIRFRGYTNFQKTVLLTQSMSLQQATQIENWASHTFSQTEYKFTGIFSGKTECYNMSPTELITCVEYIQNSVFHNDLLE